MAQQIRGMILAAGLGKRLRPLTYFRAKAAVPLLNRPLLSYSLQLFRQVGIESVMINLHHLPDTVSEALGDASFDTTGFLRTATSSSVRSRTRPRATSQSEKILV